MFVNAASDSTPEREPRVATCTHVVRGAERIPNTRLRHDVSEPIESRRTLNCTEKAIDLALWLLLVSIKFACRPISENVTKLVSTITAYYSILEFL